MASSGLRKVEVIAGYRLHLGFYRFLDPPYAYGGLGVALEEPSLSVSVSLVNEDVAAVNAPTEESGRIAAEVLKDLGVRGVSVRVSGFVKHHVGLGSRTRLIASLCRALLELGVVDGDIEGLVKRVSGCSVSSVGLYTFMKGGLVADSGIRVGRCEHPSLLLQLRFPTNWVAVVCVPRGVRGLDEAEERPILSDALRAHPKQAELYSAFMKVVNAVLYEDFTTFSKSLRKLQLLTGEYFSEFQGGVFRSGASEYIVRTLSEEGVEGVGQSSWGPTIYGFVESPVRGAEVAGRVARRLEEAGIKADVFVSRIPPLKGYQILRWRRP